MPVWIQWVLIGVGLAAIVVLSVLIARHLRTLRTRKQQQQQLAQKQEAFLAKRHASMVESIRIIAMAVEADQVEYSEACLRIKGLLDYVAPELLDDPEYVVFRTIHDAISHMPTHQARKDLQKSDPKAVRCMDKERFALEQQHADAILAAARAIKSHPF
ncbi:MAG: DUF2489 domain-containing protein [Marinobacter sp.]|nr:DUF2489 domain-containing protein [Marinobacter sp.]